MKFLAVIFDFDGVIADTERLHYEAFSRTFQEFDIRFSWETYCDKYLHYGDREFLAVVARDHGLILTPSQVSALVLEKVRHFDAINDTGKAPLFEGVQSLLDELTARNVPVGLCSSGSAPEILPVLEHYQLRAHFQAVVTIEDVKRGKPHPEGYQLAFEMLKASVGADWTPDQVVAIEDSPGGIRAALDAGLGTVGIGSSYPLSKLAHAHRTFTSLGLLDAATLLTTSKDSSV